MLMNMKELLMKSLITIFLIFTKKCTEIKRIQIQIPQRWLNRSERYRGGVSKITPPPYIAPVFENSPGDIFQKTFG